MDSVIYSRRIQNLHLTRAEPGYQPSLCLIDIREEQNTHHTMHICQNKNIVNTMYTEKANPFTYPRRLHNFYNETVKHSNHD